MKAIVIGGTGATGNSLIEELLKDNRFSEVTVLLRKKINHSNPKIRQYIIDFEQINDYSKLIQGDVAFSCLGTTLKIAGSQEAQWRIDYDYQYNFAEIAKRNNIPNFVLVSAIGASPNSSFFYTKMKGELEQSIIDLGFEKTLIFQPSVLIRPNSDRFAEKVATTIMKGFTKIGILKKHKPTHVNDLAKAMINSVFNLKQGKNYLQVKEIHDLATNNTIH